MLGDPCMHADTQITSGLLNTAAALKLVPLPSGSDASTFGTGFGAPLFLHAWLSMAHAKPPLMHVWTPLLRMLFQ